MEEVNRSAKAHMSTREDEVPDGGRCGEGREDVAPMGLDGEPIRKGGEVVVQSVGDAEAIYPGGTCLPE
jgi:hypothetical protein